MTDNGEQEQAAELARQAEALREQSKPVLRSAQQYLDGWRAADADLAAITRQVRAAVAPEISKALAAIWLSGTVHGDIRPQNILFPADAEVRIIDPPELSELSARAAREGLAGLSPLQVLAVVLVWLLAVGVPVAQQALPPEAQTVVSNEYGTLGLGIAITLLIVQNRKR